MAINFNTGKAAYGQFKAMAGSACKVMKPAVESKTDTFNRMIKEELNLWSQTHHKLSATEPIPTAIWKNARKMAGFDKLTQNILNDVKDYKLKSDFIDGYTKLNDLVKSGWLLKDSPILKSLAETVSLASHLDPIKDRMVCDAISARLKEALKYAKLNDVTHYFENIEQLAGIPVHSAGKAAPISGRTMDAHKLIRKDPSKRINEDIKDLNEACKTQQLVDFLTDETVPALCGVPVSQELNKHLYKNYYLTRKPKEVSDSLEAIHKYYGTATFVPHNATDGQADDILREFHAWNRVGGKNVNHEKVLDYTNYDPFFYKNKNAAAFASPKNFIRVTNKYLGIAKENPYPALRHEKMHRNDLNRGGYFGEPLEFGRLGPKKQYDFTEGGPILKDKTWYRNEFKNAGIGERHIDYAYTNRLEFLAVAAEGDTMKYSDEFKQVLVDLGMPKWFFGIRKFKTYN